MAGISRRAFLSWLSTSGLALTGVTALAEPASADAGGGDVLVLTGGTLIDGTGGKPRQNATIVTVGDRIVAIGRPRHALPDGVRVVDLRGKYVLPGLWDAHAHTDNLPKIHLPLWLANGVTSVREMWGLAHLPAMRERIETGEILGPRMVIASKMMDGPYAASTDPSNAAVVRTPEEAKAAVRAAKNSGADFVKIWSLLEPELFEAISIEAHRRGLPLSGHLPDRVPVLDGIRAGMTTMEHLHGIPLDVSSRRDEHRALINSTPVDPANPAASYFFARQLEMEALKAYAPRRAERLFSALRRSRTVLTPTMTVQRFFTFPPSFHREDPRVKYMPPWLVSSWNASMGPEWTPAQIEAGQAHYRAVLELVESINEAEVLQLAGSDSLVPYQFAGFSLQDELGWLVDGGLTPMQAILAATRNPARVVGLGHLSGTVQPGKWADLLVVDADPLVNIRNTQRIHAVVARGRLITRAERERMLAAVAAEAQVTPPPPPPTPAASCCGNVGLYVRH